MTGGKQRSHLFVGKTDRRHGEQPQTLRGGKSRAMVVLFVEVLRKDPLSLLRGLSTNGFLLLQHELITVLRQRFHKCLINRGTGCSMRCYHSVVSHRGAKPCEL